MIEPFSISIDDEVLIDLHDRLERTRWPDEIGNSWQYGTDLTYLRSLCDYWHKGFDWRAQEAELNRFDHYRTEIADKRLHFIHQRSTHVNAIPLLMTHGWPGSISEFAKILPMLTQPERFGGDPADAFHVVCPSIPGYGFSAAPDQPGFDQSQVARGHIELMQRLGYERYGVQGGDWGSAISTWNAALAPSQVIGLHLNLVFAGMPKHKKDPFAGVSEEERSRLEVRRLAMAEGTGYQAIQGTKPQTLGYGLNDSPAGLAGWITEKFHSWTDSHGDLESCVSRDELLTNIMIYWVTGTATSAARLYYESRHSDQSGMYGDGRIATPTGYAMFPGELYQPPRAWVEELYNVVHWTAPAAGGHFAALEQPALLADDVRQFFRPLRGNPPE